MSKLQDSVRAAKSRNLGENKSPPETLESLQPIAPLQISSAAESTTASMLDLDDNSHWEAWPSFSTESLKLPLKIDHPNRSSKLIP